MFYVKLPELLSNQFLTSLFAISIYLFCAFCLPGLQELDLSNFSLLLALWAPGVRFVQLFLAFWPLGPPGAGLV